MARILIIDDTQGNREFARIALESIGHEVLEASTGREGLAVALRTLPDLVLLDLRLPEWDGFTKLIEFRKETAINPHSSHRVVGKRHERRLCSSTAGRLFGIYKQACSSV